MCVHLYFPGIEVNFIFRNVNKRIADSKSWYWWAKLTPDVTAYIYFIVSHLWQFWKAKTQLFGWNEIMFLWIFKSPRESLHTKFSSPYTESPERVAFFSNCSFCFFFSNVRVLLSLFCQGRYTYIIITAIKLFCAALPLTIQHADKQHLLLSVFAFFVSYGH